MTLLLVSTPSNIHAQEDTPLAPNDPNIEEVVVIGSLIKRKEVYDGRAPVQALDSKLFKSTGAAQTVDILSSLTANTGSYLATQQTYLQGLSQFNLRGVGLSSTLTLVNGRRAGIAPVSNDVGQTFFDINSLPVLLIDRVDILRDGASSTYGSQAVAGVANIVTRKDISGLEIDLGYRTATNQTLDIGFATGLRSSKGFINLVGSWLEQDENFRTEFDWLSPRAIDPNRDGNIVDGSFDTGRGSPGSFRRVFINEDGSYSPFQIEGMDSPRFPDPDCMAGGGYLDGSLCRMDFSDQRTMIAAEERLQLFSAAEYDLSDKFTVFSEVGYSRNEISDRVGAMLLFNGNVLRTNEFFVPANHPFNFWTDPNNDGLLTYINPSEWNPELHDAVPLGYFGRPLGVEANGSQAGYERRTYDNLRWTLGLKRYLNNRWTVEGYLTHAASKIEVLAERHWEANQFARVIAAGEWNPFGTRLVSPDLTTPKTVEHDDLLPALANQRAANDETTLSEFEKVRTEHGETILNVVEIVASGDLFQWGYQPIKVAIGAQLRDSEYDFTPDPINLRGEGPRGLREFRRHSEQRVWATFVEGLANLGSWAELQLAARHEDYDLAGASTDPKVAAQFFINDSLSFRLSGGSSFQAPSIFQQAGNTSGRTLTDPFRFNSQGMGECVVDTDGSILNRGDNFATQTVLQGGDLMPQTAHMISLGSLLKPIPGSGLSLDFWSLDYRNVITQGQSFQAIIDEDCRDDGIPNDPRVQRDSSGQLSVVTTDYENVGATRSHGWDLNAYYEFPSNLGNIRLSTDATWMTRFDVSTSGEGFTDQLGSRNDQNGFAPTPELRLNVGLTVQRDKQTVNLAVRYIDSYLNDEVASLPEISAWTTVDLNYQTVVASFKQSQLGISVGVRNIFDKDPPPLPTGQEGDHRYNLRPGFDGFVHDIKGRVFYVRFRLSPGD